MLNTAPPLFKVHKISALYDNSWVLSIFAICHACGKYQSYPDFCGASPGVDGVTVAGQWLGGGSRVHVASIGPSGSGRFRGVMLLHGRHRCPWAGALGSSCSPFLLIGTEKTWTHSWGHATMHKSTCYNMAALGKGTSFTSFFSVNTTNRANGGLVVNMWSVLAVLTYAWQLTTAGFFIML